MSLFEPQSVLSTAASTFNNAALASPWFLQLAIVSVLVFVAAWLSHADILARIAPDAKKRPLAVKAWIFFLIALWAAFGVGNFGVLREGASWVELIVPAVLFLASAGAANAAVKYGSVPATRWSKWARVCAVVLLIAVVGFFGARDIYGIFLPMSALVAGFITGFYSARYAGVPQTRAPYSYPIISSSMLMLLAAACVLIQPELFRFGQLGNLGVLQLAGFAVVAMAAPLASVLALMARVKRSKGFLNAVAHGRVMWLLRLVVLLCLVLFFITESIVAFIILSLSMVPFAMVSGGHQPYSEAKSVNAFVFDLWCVVMFAFGLVSGVVALAFLGIVLFRSGGRKNFASMANQLL
ncbi:MAG: CorA family divalent cation transporter [Rickettsiales bacterium]|jgi:hypothetical protein|nr:CorA family divalent cation transporter [Rickettsiales bacterium]